MNAWPLPLPNCEYKAYEADLRFISFINSRSRASELFGGKKIDQ